MLKGLSPTELPNCEWCLMGKQSCKSFPKEYISRANQPLQEMHIGIYGPIQSCSFGKILYFFLLMIIVEEHEYAS